MLFGPASLTIEQGSKEETLLSSMCM
uniref:Uncharacterized protein n=1 Tax=Anguilla anguilla TaxID=7936 RepID=A0A0E9QBP2_ANGAN